MNHEPPPTQEDLLLECFLALETPEGLRAELIEGEIVVTPPPVGAHAHCLSELVRQMYRQSRTDIEYSGHKGLIPGRANRAIPDATFSPRDLRLFRGAAPWMPCTGVAMVTEVTDSRPDLDRVVKRRCYARASIPLYLLVDREEQRVTLHSEPLDGDYAESRSAAFGRPVPLPAPFSFDLETTEFV